KAGVVVEINTGGMSLKAVTSPYHSVDFLKILRKLDVPILFSSDAHSEEHIVYGFDVATAVAKSAGYSERYYLTTNGWKKKSL
ncbi:MAG: histidinol phosphate phosphatase, partial [Treponemataceae bacterium]|nr:histidinol phosphate phosphatase [Treponemataceae bacterium]